MQFGSTKPARGIVFDSSFGETIDTVLALALLHGLEGKNQAKIAALTSSKSNLKSAQLCDVIEKFYSSANTGFAAIFASAAPIGLSVDSKMKADTPMLTETLARKDAEGKPVYSPRITQLNQTAITEVLIRNALTAQYDGNAAVVMAGPAGNLARLLTLKGTKELIANKVRFLVIAGGDFPSGQPDANFANDLPAARRVLAEWPTPVVFCGREVGNQLPFPGESIEKDFAYSPAHPVADAYRACHAMPYDAPSGAMAAALYAARPDEKYFQLSDPGSVTLTDDGRTQFRPSPGGKHRYLIVDPAQKDLVIKTYREMASAKPAARSFRRPPQVQNAEEKDAAKEKKLP